MKLFLALLLSTTNYIQVDIVFTGEMAGQYGMKKATWINPNYPPTLGGMASFFTLVKELKTRNTNIPDTLLLFDAGGALGGNLMGEGANPKLTATLMNIIGYNAMNVGVRDLNLGLYGLRKLARFARFPLISSNLQVTPLEDANLLKKYLLIDVKGIKIGVFGLINENALFYVWKHNQKNLRFLKDVKIAEKMVKTLRNHGADVVILLSGLGFRRDTMLARIVQGIDLIIGSFDGFGLRNAYEDPINHTIVVRTYNGLSEVGLLSLFIDKNHKTITGYVYKRETLFTDKYFPSPVILELLSPTEKASSLK